MDWFKASLGIGLLACVIIFTVQGGCTSERRTSATLEAAGYTDVEVGGWKPWSCGGDDTCTGFKAVGPTGHPVKGAVGCGWFTKACTIRIEP